MKLEVASPKTMLVTCDEQLEYGVSSQDWEHLRGLVDGICVAEPIHLTIATFLIGISATAFFAALSLPADILLLEYPGRLVSWTICLSSLCGAVPCGLYAYMQRSSISTSKNSVLDYLNHLEKKFGEYDEESLDEV
jgi:hypothetical protein